MALNSSQDTSSPLAVSRGSNSVSKIRITPSMAARPSAASRRCSGVSAVPSNRVMSRTISRRISAQSRRVSSNSRLMMASAMTS